METIKVRNDQVLLTALNKMCMALVELDEATDNLGKIAANFQIEELVKVFCKHSEMYKEIELDLQMIIKDLKNVRETIIISYN